MYSFRQSLLLGLLWIFFCSWVVTFHKNLTGITWGESALLVAPPLIIKLFVCLSYWYLCKIITLDNRFLEKLIMIHLPALVIINSAWLLLIMLYSRLLDSIFKTDRWFNLFQESILIFLGVGISLYFIFVLIYYLILANERIRRIENEAIQQKLYALQAELKALKATIHPHFLFNSLNMISPLLVKSPYRAQQFVSRLADFLLYSLKYGKKQQVTVQEELEHIQNYLAIEKVRLGKRLRLDFSIEEKALTCPIQPFSMLPLVENAVKHGISQCLKGGSLEINAGTENNNLYIEISNPYDRTAKPVRGDRSGLATLKKRINMYYGNTGRLIVDKKEALFSVKMILPILFETGEKE